MLQFGDQVNLSIKTINQDGETKQLGDYLTGNVLVVYFYPKDDTPGCTMEACSFRDTNRELIELGATIVGVSRDPIKSHQKFIKKHKLNFPLLSDEDFKLQKLFGTDVEKSMFGKKVKSTLRATFLLDKQGKILQVWSDIKKNEEDQHPAEVADYVRDLVQST